MWSLLRLPRLSRLALLCGMLAVAPTVSAQTTYATITGTVTDPTGALVEGAAVTATNIETSITTKATTNNQGVYTVAQLREGPYMLSIVAPGFREFIATNIVLVTRDIRRIDAMLQVGGVETAVQVTGGNAPIELETPRIFNIPQYASPNMNVTPTNVGRGRISAIGGSSGFIQQAGMRSMRLGFRMEW